jgi:metal-responsive CopG/Arc/MetJ family transcriptional regulator
LRRALVSLPDGVWQVIDKELKGKIGDGDSEVIRNLVIAHLTEKGYLLPNKSKPSQFGQIADEVEMLDTMVNSLVEVMEEKGQIRYSDWEGRIKKKIQEKTKSQ